MVSVEIKQVIGKAGTGKTTYARRIAKRYAEQKKTIYCLSFTHNSVENMKNRDFPKECNFSTLHSFFRIGYTGDVLGCYKYFDVLIIDEFSLIDAEIFDKCIGSIYRTGNELKIQSCMIYLVGDPLQLGAVNENNTISYNKIEKFSQRIPYKDIDLNAYIGTLKHLSGLTINSELVRDLTTRCLTLSKNHRSEEHVMDAVNKVIFKTNIEPIIENFHSTDEIIKKIFGGCVAIASSYNILKNINYRFRSGEDTDIVLYHDWLYRKNEQVYATINTSCIYNGEICKILDADTTSVTLDTKQGKNVYTDLYIQEMSGEKLSKKVPIVMPGYLYTFHKCQGLEFDDVAICLDDLFAFPMLYTGMTRAKKNIYFFTMNGILYKYIMDYKKLDTGDEKERKSLLEAIKSMINIGSEEINIIEEIYRNGNGLV